MENDGEDELKIPVKDSGLMRIGLAQVGGDIDHDHIADWGPLGGPAPTLESGIDLGRLVCAPIGKVGRIGL